MKGGVKELNNLEEKTSSSVSSLVGESHEPRKLDVFDPAKYDFALFGIGVNEKL